MGGWNDSGIKVEAHRRRGGGLSIERGNVTQEDEDQKQTDEVHERVETPCFLKVAAVWMWQMAMARASATSGGSGLICKSSKRMTMLCTCDFSAFPYPTTALLMDSGAYSATGSPEAEAASIATPRTCPSFKADFAFTA